MRQHLPWLMPPLILSLTLLGPAAAQVAVPDAAAAVGATPADAGGSGLNVREYDLTRRMSATPADIAGYLLRPGDQLNVMVLTGEQENIELIVQLAQDGSIALPWIEPLTVNGLTIAQASTLVQQAYARIYLRAFAQVRLERLGTFLVQLQGYHPYPGLYRVYNGTSLYGLLLALNIDTDGERRQLRLERQDAPAQGNLLQLAPDLQLIGAFDSLDFSVFGKIENDLFLEPFDRIVIEEPAVVVQIDRGVTRPGKYAVRPGEGLREILELAGTVDRTADLQNTQLTRIGADGAPQLLYLDLASLLASGESFPLENRDRLRIVPYKNKVYVLGEVNLPGEYEIGPGDGILELLARAGGPRDVAHARSISVVRPPRLYADLSEPHSVEIVDIRTFIKPGKQRELPITLQAGDIIFVPRKGDRITGANILSAASAALSRISF